MPISSYIGFPFPEKRNLLIDELDLIPHCEVVPADNRDLVVIVTDTPDKAAEKEIQFRLKNLKTLQHMSLVFGSFQDTDEESEHGSVEKGFS